MNYEMVKEHTLGQKAVYLKGKVGEVSFGMEQNTTNPEIF
jgi:hypothetical protein